MKNVFLSANWQNLIMANYAIEPQLLQPYLPAGTELDFFNGKTYVSLVGFLFGDTRIRGIKIPFHVNFEEVNLRFYVKRWHEGEWRRGVVFIKEIVPKSAISFVANTVYKEKYCRMPMDHFLKKDNNGIRTGYSWRYKRRRNFIEAVTESIPVAIPPGSEAEFIAEHYFGYSRYDDFTTYEYEVKHPRWEIYPLQSYNLYCDFGLVYGHDFAFLENETPCSVFMAKGSPVTVAEKSRILLQ